MTVFSALKRLFLLLPVALSLSGCFMPSDTPADEEKDPHYLTGKNRVSSLDYDGAITAFESALAANPKSAAAHLELGFLYEERKNNYSAALYHLEKHLELRPDSNMVETVKQHIVACRLELARSVSLFLVNRQVQDELRRLYTTNTALVEKIEAVHRQYGEQIAAYSNRLVAVTQAAAQAAAQATAQAQAQAAVQSQARAQAAIQPRVTYSPEPERRPIMTERSAVMTLSRVSAPRSHFVKPGESFAMIARRYNVKVSALEAANPTIEPRRLKAGQILNLPLSRY